MIALSDPTMSLETETSLSTLDSIIKNSLSKASTHTKEVYSQNPLTASEVIEMAISRVLTLAATVRPDGRPHLAPTDFLAVDGIFYLGVDEATARYRNLKQNPAVTVMLADDRKRQAILGRKRQISRHEFWNRQAGFGGSEEEVRLGHRRASRIPAGESVYLEGKIAPKKYLDREIVQNQPLIRSRGRRFENTRFAR